MPRITHFQILMISLILASLAAVASASNPVLIVPGTGGNRLQAKLDKSGSQGEKGEGRAGWPEHPPPLTHPPHPPPRSVHWYCSKKADWYDLWLDVKQLVPGAIEVRV